MSANLLHSLADDKPDLCKQRGCRTGRHQHSNPQYLVEGGQISWKRLPSGNFTSIALLGSRFPRLGYP